MSQQSSDCNKHTTEKKKKNRNTPPTHRRPNPSPKPHPPLHRGPTPEPKPDGRGGNSGPASIPPVSDTTRPSLSASPGKWAESYLLRRDDLAPHPGTNSPRHPFLSFPCVRSSTVLHHRFYALVETWGVIARSRCLFLLTHLGVTPDTTQPHEICEATEAAGFGVGGGGTMFFFDRRAKGISRS